MLFGAHAFIWAGEWTPEGAEKVIGGGCGGRAGLRGDTPAASREHGRHRHTRVAGSVRHRMHLLARTAQGGAYALGTGEGGVILGKRGRRRCRARGSGALRRALRAPGNAHRQTTRGVGTQGRREGAKERRGTLPKEEFRWAWRQ
jgi:hypothetical protein